MPISIQCPNPVCAKTSTASDGIEGKRVRCKHCGQSFTASGSATQDFTGSGSRPAIRSSSQAELPAAVGRFSIRSRLGAGAFGTVYRAYDPQLDREVALKVPNPGTLDHPKRVERFLREARAAAGLRHPHIVPVFDAGQDGGVYYIASAFIAGKKLGDTFDEKGADLERAARLTRELAEALAYAHEQGIVHRDVKPDNIMVDGGDHIHLMDFGLASRQDEESKLTSDGAVMGTPGYMAPEQASGQAGEAQPAADQYSAGIVLYEMLTGRVPFEGPVAVVIHNQIHTEPDRPSALREGIPKDLETICLKALSKRPEDRYEDCQEMADDLRRWSEGEPIAARRMSAAERLNRWVRKNKAIALVSGLAAAFLVVGIVATSIFAVRASDEAERATDYAKRADDEAKRADSQSIEAKNAQALAERNAKAALASEGQQKIRSADLCLDRGLSEFNRGSEAAGVLWLAKGLQVCGGIDRELDAILRAQLSHWLTKAPKVTGYVEFTGTARSVAVSRDGTLWATGNSSGKISVWEAKSGVLVGRFSHDGRVICLAFGAGGRYLMAGTSEKGLPWMRSPNGDPPSEVRLWDLRNPDSPYRTFVHPEGVTGVAMLPNDETVVTASGDGKIRVWAVTGAARPSRVLEHGGPIYSMALSEDGRSIVTGGDDGRVRVWDTQVWSDQIYTLANLGLSTDPKPRITDIGLHPNGRSVVLGLTGIQQAAVVAQFDRWNANEKKYLRHAGGVDGVDFINGGNDIITNSNEGVAVWNVASSKRILNLYRDTFDLTRVRRTPGRGFVVLSGRDSTSTGKLIGWDVGNGPASSLKYRNEGGTVARIAVSPDGTRIGTAGSDGTARLWEAVSGSPQFEPIRHPGKPESVCFSPDGSLFVSGWSDGHGAVTDTGTGREVATFRGPEAGLKTLAFSSNRSLYAGGTGGIRIWDAVTWKEKPPLSMNPRSKIASIGLDRKGRTLLEADGSGQLSCYALDGAKTSEESLPRLAVLCAAALSGDGSLYATSTWSGNSQTWSLKEKKRVGLPRQHDLAATDVTFSPDDRFLATVSRDDTVRQWEARSGRPLGPVFQYPAGFSGNLAYSHDGKKLLAAGDTPGVRVWNLPDPVTWPVAAAETWAELLTGSSLDASGATQYLSQKEWADRKKLLGK